MVGNNRHRECRCYGYPVSGCRCFLAGNQFSHGVLITEDHQAGSGNIRNFAGQAAAVGCFNPGLGSNINALLVAKVWLGGNWFHSHSSCISGFKAGSLTHRSILYYFYSLPSFQARFLYTRESQPIVINLQYGECEKQQALVVSILTS